MLRLIDVKNVRNKKVFFKKCQNIAEMSRKNAFGPIGRLEPPQLARDTFLLSKISGFCTHLSLGARREPSFEVGTPQDSNQSV